MSILDQGRMNNTGRFGTEQVGQQSFPVNEEVFYQMFGNREQPVALPPLEEEQEAVAYNEKQFEEDAALIEQNIFDSNKDLPVDTKQYQQVLTDDKGVVQNKGANVKNKDIDTPYVKTPTQGTPDVQWKWDDILSPEAPQSRQAERRAYYTTLLATGNVGKAFAAMYNMEEDQQGKFKRNAQRDYMLSQGYLPETVQNWIHDGNTEKLAKQQKEKLDLIEWDDGFYYTRVGPNGPIKVGSAVRERKKTDEALTMYTDTVEGVNIFYDKNGEEVKRNNIGIKKSDDMIKTEKEVQAIPGDLETLNQLANSRFNTLGKKDKYTWVGTSNKIPGVEAATSVAPEASEVDKVLAGMTIDSYSGMTGAAGMTGPLEKVLINSSATRGSAEYVVSQQAADVVFQELQMAKKMRDKMLRNNASEAQIERADEIIQNLQGQYEQYNRLTQEFRGGNTSTNMKFSQSDYSLLNKY